MGAMQSLATVKQNATADGFKSPSVHAALSLLTGRQKQFVLAVMVTGLAASAAAVQAGYSSGNHATVLMRNPNVVEAIRVMQIEYAKDLEIGMSEVQQGMLDAIEVARATDNAMAMIAGWRELAKMLGLYTEKKELSINFENPEALEEANTADLLKLVGSDVIEGEIAEYTEAESA